MTEASGKRLVVVKKAQKDQTKKAIDTMISDTLFPDFQTEKTGRSNGHNINYSLVTNVAALQKEFTHSTIKLLNPPQNA